MIVVFLLCLPLFYALSSLILFQIMKVIEVGRVLYCSNVKKFTLECEIFRTRRKNVNGFLLAWGKTREHF